jgi:hypothetical protein
MKDRQAYIEEVAGKYSREDLQAWSEGILRTPHEEAPLMVAEDPSVMDVASAYIHVLEAEVEALRGDNERLRTLLRDAHACGRIMSNVCWSLGHEGRDVGDRKPLAALADRWDALSKTTVAQLAEMGTPGKDEARPCWLHGGGVRAPQVNCPRCKEGAAPGTAKGDGAPLTATVWCDAEGCVTRLRLSGNVRQVRAEARKYGWAMRDGKDYCKEHKAAAQTGGEG